MLLKLIPAGLLAMGAWANVINDVREAADQQNFALADSIVQKYRSTQGVTPEMITALSWLGRGALAAKQLDKAEVYANETHRLALEQLKKRPLDADGYLPIALGAAIEVKAQVSEPAWRPQRGAIAYLRSRTGSVQDHLHPRCAFKKTSTCSAWKERWRLRWTNASFWKRSAENTRVAARQAGAAVLLGALVRRL